MMVPNAVGQNYLQAKNDATGMTAIQIGAMNPYTTQTLHMSVLRGIEYIYPDNTRKDSYNKKIATDFFGNLQSILLIRIRFADMCSKYTNLNQM